MQRFSCGTICPSEKVEKFLDTISESMCACSHFFANFAVTEPLGFEVFGLGGQEPSYVSFVQCRHIRQIAWRDATDTVTKTSTAPALQSGDIVSFVTD